MRTLLLSLAIGGLLAADALASDACQSPDACTAVETCGDPGCCGHCGCQSNCKKYCKVVCEMKEVKKHVWVVKCDEFCTSLPNCGRKCCGGCDSCTPDATCSDCRAGKCDPCAVEKNKRIVPPRCGKMRVKKTLVKKEIVCKVPSYKCVVVYCCSSCGPQECGTEDAAAEAPVPTPGKTTQNVPTPPVVGASFVK